MAPTRSRSQSQSRGMTSFLRATPSGVRKRCRVGLAPAVQNALRHLGGAHQGGLEIGVQLVADVAAGHVLGGGLGSEMGPPHGGAEKREADEQKAERMVASELRKRPWTKEDLQQRRKTDATKVKLALRLGRETVMRLPWIAERLQMGCRDTLANCLKAAKFNNSRD